MLRRHPFKYQLTGLLYVPFVLVLAYFTYRHPDALMLYGLGAFLLTATLIALVVLPVGRMQFGPKVLSFGAWMVQVLTLEILMVLLFIAGILAFFSAGPLFAAQNLSLEAVRGAVDEYSWLLWSFFPWCGILIWAVCSAYYYHIRRAGPYPHQTCQDTMKNFIEPQTKAFVEANVFTANMVCLMVTFAIAVLLTSYAIEIYFGLIPHTLGAPITFMILGLVVFLFLWRLSKKRIRKLERKGLTVSGLLTMLFIGYVLAIVYSSYALEWILHHADKINLQQLQCHCQHFFDSTTTEGRFAAYYWGWGLMWTPMAGSYLVKISQGRTMRQMILGFSFLPILILLIIVFKSDWIAQSAKLWIRHFSPHTSDTIKAALLLPFAGIAFMAVHWMTKGQTNSRFLNAGFLQQQPTYQAGRLKLKEGVKLFGLSKLAMPLLFASLSMISMHALGGWYLIQLSVVLLAPILMHFVYSACVFIWVQFIQRGLLF